MKNFKKKRERQFKFYREKNHNKILNKILKNMIRKNRTIKSMNRIVNKCKKKLNKTTVVRRDIIMIATIEEITMVAEVVTEAEEVIIFMKEVVEEAEAISIAEAEEVDQNINPDTKMKSRIVKYKKVGTIIEIEVVIMINTEEMINININKKNSIQRKKIIHPITKKMS
jgi:hypothetical protein